MAVRAGQDEQYIFNVTSNGVKTNRDAWAYNSGYFTVADNMRRSIEFYNGQAELAVSDASHEIDLDPRKMKWDFVQNRDVMRGRKSAFRQEAITTSLYRPFIKQCLYYDSFWNNRTFQMPKIFPRGNEPNYIITVNQNYYISSVKVNGEPVELENNP